MRVLISSLKEMCVKTHTLGRKCVCVSSLSNRHSLSPLRGEGGFTGGQVGGERVGGGHVGGGQVGGGRVGGGRVGGERVGGGQVGGGQVGGGHVGGERVGGGRVGGERVGEGRVGGERVGGGRVGGGHAWMCGSSAAVLSALRGDVQVLQDFISEEEEAALLTELEPGLRRKRYEFDHWDDAIHGFRETERLQWGGVCASVLERLRAAAFPEGTPLLGPVHVLDLDKAGFIKAHVDSVKFCGSTIAGVSLLSDSVMRLVHVDNSANWVDLLLRRRSLYILRDEVRFKFTHEILKDDDSYFSGQKIPRQRRISVICRNLPVSTSPSV